MASLGLAIRDGFRKWEADRFEDKSREFQLLQNEAAKVQLQAMIEDPDYLKSIMSGWDASVAQNTLTTAQDTEALKGVADIALAARRAAQADTVKSDAVVEAAPLYKHAYNAGLSLALARDKAGALPFQWQLQNPNVVNRAEAAKYAADISNNDVTVLDNGIILANPLGRAASYNTKLSADISKNNVTILDNGIILAHPGLRSSVYTTGMDEQIASSLAGRDEAVFNRHLTGIKQNNMSAIQKAMELGFATDIINAQTANVTAGTQLGDAVYTQNNLAPLMRQIGKITKEMELDTSKTQQTNQQLAKQGIYPQYDYKVDEVTATKKNAATSFAQTLGISLDKEGNIDATDTSSEETRYKFRQLLLISDALIRAGVPPKEIPNASRQRFEEDKAEYERQELVKAKKSAALDAGKELAKKDPQQLARDAARGFGLPPVDAARVFVPQQRGMGAGGLIMNQDNPNFGLGITFSPAAARQGLGAAVLR